MIPRCVHCGTDNRALYLYDRGDGEPEAVCVECWDEQPGQDEPAPAPPVSAP